MPLKELVDHLKKQLQEPLPGLKTQLALLSGTNLEEYKTRIQTTMKEAGGDNVRHSSVLIMFYEKNGSVFFPLIKRPEYDGVHSGQIALPGGKVEPDDLNISATALRETDEEIGISADQIEVIGTLTPVYIPPSKFWVNVVVGYCTSLPVFKTDEHEVAALIEFPLDQLFLPERVETREVSSGKNWKMNVPGYVYEGHFIWGATSMILTELKVIVLKENNFR